MPANVDTVRAALAGKSTKDSSITNLDRDRHLIKGGQVKVGIPGGFMVIDKNKKTVEFWFDGSEPIILNSESSEFPGSIKITSPRRLEVSPGMTLNPDGATASSAIIPIPAFKSIPNRLSGILPTIMAVLGA